MIKLLRVDDSFLYGNKGLQWVNATRARVIVLIDDGLKCDHFAQSLLAMACPVSAEIIFLDVEEGRKAIERYSRSREPVLITVGSFSQLLELSDHLSGLTQVNVGSVRGNSTCELHALKRLQEKELEFEICDYPDDTAVRLE